MESQCVFCDVGCEVLYLPKCIPSIVNGQINPTKKESNNNSANNFRDQIHNLVRESTVKVHNDETKYCKCSKQKS